jgi:bacterioferritin (cytochrome b1)
MDEISAATFYVEAANMINDLEVIEEIREHAKDEFKHFTWLMDYAKSHDLPVKYDFDRKVIKNVNQKNEKIIKYIQSLEKKAISDYRDMMIYAQTNQDIESAELFKKIMLEEMEHFDDIAPKLGQKRVIGEGFKKYFRKHK